MIDSERLFLSGVSLTNASNDHCDTAVKVALTKNRKSLDVVSSLHRLNKVLSFLTGGMAATPRFESLPPEIRNMVYSYLLPPVYLKKIRKTPNSTLNPLYWASDSQTADTAILRTNRNVNREASAVVYRDILLVSIEWRSNSRVCLDFNDISHRIRFNLVPRGASAVHWIQTETTMVPGYPRSSRLRTFQPSAASYLSLVSIYDTTWTKRGCRSQWFHCRRWDITWTS